ncbi:SKP1-interacting partner 15 [Striga hermonthica]|uniref:SKP1-interacting partner 15 n=1 Tax=Striga hermonthica TaxID=68872 RepID=A0A9N7MT08_STRHE|nr:SKP1-interacting partner 15 [Striga hermonthica]
MDDTPLDQLPPEILLLVFLRLPLRHIAVSHCVCRSLCATLSSPHFLRLLSLQRLLLLTLCPSFPSPIPYAYDPDSDRWLHLSLSFLPFVGRRHVIAASHGRVYLWAASTSDDEEEEKQSSPKALVVCNPLTGWFVTLPKLGSVWAHHGSVICGPDGSVLLLTDLAVMYSRRGGAWRNFSSELPTMPRTPVIISDSILLLCNLGAIWRPRWAIYSGSLQKRRTSIPWTRLEGKEWDKIFAFLKCPSLVQTGDDRGMYVVGGLMSSNMQSSVCLTIVIIRFDLETMWLKREAHMPTSMFKYFKTCGKYKVFGGGNRVCFSAYGIGKMAVWEGSETGKWGWVDSVPVDDEEEGAWPYFMLDDDLDCLL